MRKRFIFLITIFAFFVKGYAQQMEIVTLGVFHFDFPNLDAQQYSENEQIDVLQPDFQKEIELISDKLARLKPDAIVIEAQLNRQMEIDSLFKEYLNGNYILAKSEVQQLGFRIAAKCHSKIYCADTWGKFTAPIEKLLENDNSPEYLAFDKTFEKNPDSLLYHDDIPIFKQKGILAELIRLNNPERINKDLGNYLIGHFNLPPSNSSKLHHRRNI